ncbi:hypothetical protein BDF22DRAFT_616851 [Syncephalis plumigaleata]|nr:hypothetical protein BDF22DRAFT_616851 [Syncephalis plumigaleata]
MLGTFETSYMRSSGPGGQNVNKLSTKVDMRFELQYASWLPEAVREKLGQQEATRLNKHGELVFTSDRTRSQKMNLEDCIDKLYDAILRASQVPKEPDAEQQAKVKRM